MKHFCILTFSQPAYRRRSLIKSSLITIQRGVTPFYAYVRCTNVVYSCFSWFFLFFFSTPYVPTFPSQLLPTEAFPWRISRLHYLTAWSTYVRFPRFFPLPLPRGARDASTGESPGKPPPRAKGSRKRPCEAVNGPSFTAVRATKRPLPTTCPTCLHIFTVTRTKIS